MTITQPARELACVDQRRLVVIQRNPGSGRGQGRYDLLCLVRELLHRGFHVRLFRSRQRLDHFLRTPERRATLRCLVAAGGDGTVTDLLNRHPEVPIAVFPLGTENLLARYLKIRRHPELTVRMIEKGHIVTLDCGLAGDYRFLLMLSAGIDAQVVRYLHAVRSGTIRYSSYFRPVMRAFCSYSMGSLKVTVADQSSVVQGSHVLIANIPAYGFGFRFTPDAIADDGLLDIRVYHGQSRVAALGHATSVRLGWARAEHHVTRIQATCATLAPLDSSQDIPVQCDGDPGPPLPLTITVDRRSLTVLVPEGTGHQSV